MFQLKNMLLSFLHKKSLTFSKSKALKGFVTPNGEMSNFLVEDLEKILDQFE